MQPKILLYCPICEFSIVLLFEVRDCWIGLYWDRSIGESYPIAWTVYVCLIPMLPIPNPALQLTTV